jgi:methylmalonyl-CoA mutase cobalamin-binding domain/chain
MVSKHLYPIRYASRRTNLTPHVIRAWEKRYKAVVPQRSQKNRRLYSEDDVQRLYLLKIITDAGHNISQVAQLTSDELEHLARQENILGPRSRNEQPKTLQPEAVDDYYTQCLAAVRNLDSDGLERSYDQAAVDLTRTALVRDLIMPLFEEIGNLWRKGSMKILNEHMATAITRNLLVNMLRASGAADSAPRILIATSVGQWHDIGALVVALTAADSGWQPVYYGPNLPAEEIAAGARQSGARAVALSITHLLDQPSLADELRKLRRYLGRELALFVGGRAVGDDLHILNEVDARYINTLDQFSEELDRLLIARKM